MPNLLNETKFEEHIAGCLAQGDLYNQRTSADFSIEELCDRGMLERFLRAQSQTWQKLSLAYPGKEVDAVVTEYNKKLNRGESILTILQKGFKIKGIPIKFVQFKPILDGPESPAYVVSGRSKSFTIS